MGNVYLTVDKQWLEKNKAKASKEYRETFKGEENPDQGLKFDLDTKENVDSDSGSITWHFTGDAADGPFLSVTYDLDNEDYIKLSELVIKRLNKMKTAMEALEG